MGRCPARQVRLGKPHFRTLHARAGLAALLLGVAAPLGGALAFKSLGLLDGRSETLQQRVKWAHRKASHTAQHCSLGVWPVASILQSCCKPSTLCKLLVITLGVRAAGPCNVAVRPGRRGAGTDPPGRVQGAPSSRTLVPFALPEAQSPPAVTGGQPCTICSA